jgi:histidyl-tRNA synthetase
METIKGFKDKLGKDGEKAAFIRKIAEQVFEKYNFTEVETPIIEARDFVKGENSNEETISEIFKLKDRGERDLALRYEFTFQLKRIAKGQKTPFKRFQIGPVFRDEPVKGNRLRQFTQCDIDVVGSKISDQAEILSAISDIMKALKVKNTIYVNNRKILNEILEEQKIKEKENAIRILDKLDKQPEKQIKEELKQIGAENLLKIVKQPEDYFKKYPSYSEILELKKYCKMYGVQIEFQQTLARGLAYYTGNVFEIKSDIKETICGGGTYLVNDIESTGISFSIERMMAVTNIRIEVDKILIVSLDQDAQAIALSKKLRQEGKNVSVFFGKPSKALDYANSYGIKKVIFVGKKEVEKKRYMVKDMQTGKEKILTVTKVRK